MRQLSQSFVIPAKAGTQSGNVIALKLWVPAFAGMTMVEVANV